IRGAVAMKWFLGALLLLLAALLLESGLLAYAMYVLLGLLLVSRLLARSWIANLTATRQCNQVIAEVGETVAVNVTVQNTGLLPLPWLLLEHMPRAKEISVTHPRLGVKKKRMQIPILGSGGTTELFYQIESKMRGYSQVGPLVLEGGAVFGLHRRYRVGTAP